MGGDSVYKECLLKGSPKDYVKIYHTRPYPHVSWVNRFQVPETFYRCLSARSASGSAARSEDAGVVTTPVSPVHKRDLAQFPQVSSPVLGKVENERTTGFHVHFVDGFVFFGPVCLGRPTVVQPLM